uniref:Uncharacterized protein n=1 Tax=Setaria digitata TaxID=48799 RepID=A0A915Q3V3_9BILA
MPSKEEKQSVYKHSSEELPANPQVRAIANSKGGSAREESVVDNAQPFFPYLSVPLLTAFNPFQLRHQAVATKDISSQFAHWFQPLRSDLFRPSFLPNNGVLLGTTQTHPTNLTHLGNFGELMNSNSLLLKLVDYGQKRRNLMNNDGLEGSLPNNPETLEIASKDEAKTDEISKSTPGIVNMDGNSEDGNATDMVESPKNFYDADLGMVKIPEAEESDEVSVENDSGSRNLLEKKVLQNGFDDRFWNHLFQIKDVGNSTESSLNDLKEVVATLNLSQTQTAAFVKIIEKIVDEQLKRRLHEEVAGGTVAETPEKPKLAGAKFHALDSELLKNTGEVYEEEIRPHEKLTANTRLSFDEQHIIDDYRSEPDEISEELDRGPSELDSKKAVRWKTDYMIREQAEYDRLVSGITEATPQLEYLETKTEYITSSELLRTTTTGTTSSPTFHDKAILQSIKERHTPNRTTMIYAKVASIPRTVFERQADDFRSRLLGNNGFNDIINALKHAKIGFYERN